MSRSLAVALTSCLLAFSVSALAAPAGAVQGSRYHEGASGTAGVIATESPAAARAGRAVLARGGNAIDAAVTTVFALGAARPQSCGIGGGGFMVYRSPDGKVRALDFRETAGAAMKADTFVPPGLHKTFTGHLTVGVPGTVAGMAAALERFGSGKVTWVDALSPAERLARIGFRVPTSLSGAMARRAKDIALFPASAAQYLRNGSPYQPGEVLKQPDMARSLRRLMADGPKALYGGTLAKLIVRDMRAPRPQTTDAGLLTVKDFAKYRAVWRTALHTTYRGRDVYAAPPVTSGGTTMMEILNIVEGFDLRGWGAGSAQAVAAIAEAQKIAWADRGAYLADPAFVRQPTAQLVSKEYAAARRNEIDLRRAGSYKPGVFPTAPSAVARAAGEDFNPAGSTTHVSVIDAEGGAVAVTCTIEQEFGSAVVAPGTGFLLNNELTDFSGPGTANEPAPGKRPRSSINPTIVAQSGKPVLVAGAAGGSTIIMGPTLAVINTVDFGMTLPQAVDAERFDDQGTSRLTIEDARFSPAVLDQLRAIGYTLAPQGEYGVTPRMQLAGLAPGPAGVATAVSDSRSDRGSLAVPASAPRPTDGRVR